MRELARFFSARACPPCSAQLGRQRLLLPGSTCSQSLEGSAQAPKSAAAGNPSLIFRPAATAAPTTQQGPGTPAPGSTSSGRKLLQTFPTNGTGSCVTDAPGLGAAAAAANAQACALAATFATNCTCAAANAGRKLLQALTFTGRQQFFGECVPYHSPAHYVLLRLGFLLWLKGRQGGCLFMQRTLSD